MSPLSSGNLKRDYFRFATPTMLALMVFSAYSMVDGAFVGHLIGKEALAAVNIGAPFLSLMFSVSVLMAQGTGTIVANLFGRRQEGAASRLFTQNVVCVTVVGLVMGLAARAFLPQICHLLGARDEVISYAREYVGVLALFAPGILLEYNLEVLVKTDGSPRLTAITVTGACALNAFLDWFLIARAGLGVRGAAIGTGVAETAACLVFLGHFLFSKKHTLRFVAFRFDRKTFGHSLVLGLSEASTDLCIAVLTWVYNRIVFRYVGTVGLSGYSVVTYVNNIVCYTLSGASQGMQPLVSFHRGEGDRIAARKLRRYAMVMSTLVGALFVLAAELVPSRIVSVCLPAYQTELRLFSIYALRRYALSFLFIGVNYIVSGYMTACERPWQSLIVSVGRGCVIPVLMLTLLSALFGSGGIWWAAPAAESVMAILSARIMRACDRRETPLKS